jgi:pimeloyl-ACP methyl ester carboxylesterase
MSSLADPPTPIDTEREHVLELSGGRRISYVLYGPASGPTVVVLDGPGSRGLARAAADAAVEHGIRLVAPDRPGFFDSTPVPARAITDWVPDHAALLDALGIERAGIFAQSGGTPYALAVAAALPERTTALAFTGPLAPLDQAGALDEAGKQFRTAVKLGRRAPWLLRLVLKNVARKARKDPEKVAMNSVPNRAPADAAVLEEPRWRALHVQATGEILSRHAALAQEIVLLGRPWGIDLARISSPAAFWTGERDETHPPQHAYRLAALLGGDVEVVPDAATFGLLPYYSDVLEFAAG